MSIVLDASAVIAVIDEEPGDDAVRKVMRGALISSVNLSEVLAVVANRGGDPVGVASVIKGLGTKTVSFDEELALEAAKLRPLTKPYGLGLGDRACLALGISRKTKVYTADSVWTEVVVGAKVVLIR